MKSTNTDNIAQKVSSILLDLGCIIIRPNKPFTYNTGIISPVYTDNRLILSSQKERRKVINFLTDKVREIGIPDVLAGTATAGIPHTSFVAQKLNLPMVYVRSKPKEYGKENRIEGKLSKKQKVIVIDDLISTGRSCLEVVDAVRDAGGEVADVIAITTYGLKISKYNFDKKKVKLHALTDLKTTTDVAFKKGYLRNHEIGLVLNWAVDPKNWDKNKSKLSVKPVYNTNKSWDYNYKKGPNFKGPYPKVSKKRNWEFLGYKLISPLGIAAGPLPNAKWLTTYAKLGYGSLVQKTVRSKAHKSHPAPNIVHIETDLKKLASKKPMIGYKSYEGSIEKMSITNSFGNPCKSPKEWTREAKKAKKAFKNGQLFGISVYGTQEHGMTLGELSYDYTKTAFLAKKAGAEFIEANLACPNVKGAEDPFLFKNEKAVATITRDIKSQIGNIPLVLKIGYFEKYSQLTKVLKESQGFFEGISAINTIQKKIVNKNGNNILLKREVSGVCGYIIKDYGIKMVKHLINIRKTTRQKFEIIGVGGVMQPKDVVDYLDAGANHVHSATAIMWNPYLAHDLQKYLAESNK